MRSPSVVAVGVAGVGLVYVWSAIHGANVTATLRDILAGRVPAVPDPGADGGPVGRAVGGGAGESLAGESAAAAAPTGNRANGQLQAAAYGWGSGAEWAALDQLWTRESDWNNTALNSSSGAYGIAQFLDTTWATVGGTRTSDPTLQIQYGLLYIRRRYGTPSAAWAHEQTIGWY